MGNSSKFLGQLLRDIRATCVKAYFGSNWLKNWRETFKAITNRSNRYHVITFDSHFKATLVPGSLFQRLREAEKRDSGKEVDFNEENRSRSRHNVE